MLRGMLTKLQTISGEWPMLTLGCDFHLSYENVSAAPTNPDAFTIGNSQYLLLEFSDFAVSPAVEATLMRLAGVGLVPIITHPERNLLLQQDPNRMLKLLA